LEFSFIIALLLLCLLFYAFKSFEASPLQFNQNVAPPIFVDYIPPIKQLYKQPPPDIPVILVPSEDPEILDEVPFHFTDVGISDLINNSSPPPQDEEEGIPFVLASEKPKLLKRVPPAYPELARKVGSEGQVVIKVLIGKNGDVEKAEVFKSIPMLDEAALAAVKQFKFSPGKQRDKYVKVWMFIPFHFKLK